MFNKILCVAAVSAALGVLIFVVPLHYLALIGTVLIFCVVAVGVTVDRWPSPSPRNDYAERMRRPFRDNLRIGQGAGENSFKVYSRDEGDRL